ncbi:hypothetical protein DL96DRAFT_1583226 [Flagelloscypha sp. PMI_526]|nr:hypothetical protein DL96DRAFT_1583226 [Flagelloscypha sp. PMI_526]
MVKTVSKHYAGFPKDPIYVTIDYSDGDRTRFPSNTKEHFEDATNVNWMMPVPLDEATSKKWRHQIGFALAKHLGITDNKELSRYVLQDWPANYAFFDHHKGHRDNPRHDLYLFGSRTATKFRSVPEFIPHALWLSTNMTGQCECKYCTKSKSQKQVTAQLSAQGLVATRTPTPFVAMRTKKSTNMKRKKEIKTYAAIQRKPTAAMVGRPYTSESRRQWLRRHEAVWIELSTPIHGPNGIAVRFWPGIVEDITYKGVKQVNDGGNPPWVVHQNWKYKVKLCAIFHTIDVPSDRIIPWTSYSPPQDLALYGRGTMQPEDVDTVNLRLFNPTSDPPPSFEQTIPRFMLASNIIAHLTNFYCVTDTYEFKFKLPRVRMTPHPPEHSLAAAYNSANQQNAALNQQVSVTHQNLSAPLDGIPPHISSSTASTSSIATSQTKNFTQIRFQGLWWGVERIWVGDLVRLKLKRRNIAPHGTLNIRAPAGPGSQSIEREHLYCEQNGVTFDPAKVETPADRGVFMHISAIFGMDVVTAEGIVRKECRMSGQLFELVDEDWEDPIAPQPSSASEPGPLKPTPSKSRHVATQHPQKFDPTSIYKRNPLDPMERREELPEPPTSFKFRPILADGYEAVLSLSLLSGRYYPQILSLPLLQKEVPQVYPEPDSTSEWSYLWALEGMAPVSCKVDRERMLQEADTTAKQDFREHLAAQVSPKEEEMEEDQLPDEDIDMLDES